MCSQNTNIIQLPDYLIKKLGLTVLSEGSYYKEIKGDWKYTCCYIYFIEGGFMSIKASNNGMDRDVQIVKILSVPDVDFFLLVLSRLKPLQNLFPQSLFVSISNTSADIIQ